MQFRNSSSLEQNAIGVIARRRRSLPVALLAILRPRQWVKNGFVLGPLIFSRSFESLHLSKEAAIAVGAFCLASSAGYIVNDICDREADKVHPIKRSKRPIASGEVTVFQALILLSVIILALVSLLIVLPPLIPALTAYLVLTFSYSTVLKNVPVIDLFAIAFGFVLRVYTGAVAIGVVLSFWMGITTLCLALYLAAIKRRQELAGSGSGARAVLHSYTPGLLNNYAQTSSAMSVIFYGLYVATVTPALVYSMPLVMLGLFRYQYLVDVGGHGESPGDLLLGDKVLLGTIIAWAALCSYLLRPA